jgi:hypothetical protein
MKGGAIVPLQTGGVQYFPRAVILAIYADHPAAVKCTMVGKACPQCFTSESVMHLPPVNGNLELRTEVATKRFRDTFSTLRDSRVVGARENAHKRARKIGVNLNEPNPFSVEAGWTWVFGPVPRKDNVYQACPQVVLHGCDEGTTAKLARGCVQLAIARSPQTLTAVRTTPACITLHLHDN